MMSFKTGWAAIAIAAMVSIFVLTTQQAAGGKKTYTFKNTSAVSANDFFCAVDGTIDNASAYKTDPPPREQAFLDTVFDPPTKKDFKWTSSQLVNEIPMDGKMEVNVSGDSPSLAPGGCHFTRNGSQLDTKVVILEPKIVPKGDDCRGGSVEFGNAFYSETILLTGVEVRVDNTGDPEEIGPYIPDGTLVPGIPSSFSLAPGETLSFPYTATNLSLAISVSDTVALASSPDDGFYQLTAAYIAGLMVPDNVTISRVPGTDNVVIGWYDVGENLSYKIYRAIDDPSGPFMLIGTVPAGVQFFSFFAGVDAKAFYKVTGSCHVAGEPCVVECPPVGVPEGEPYPMDPDNYNGGCNSTPPVFSPIDHNQTVCGTSWANTSTRDTDWYQITLTDATHLTWTVTAEFDVLIYIINGGTGNCSDYTILGSATGDPCDVVSLGVNVGPGLYWFWVGPDGWWDLPCSDYVATLTCEAGVQESSSDYPMAAPGGLRARKQL